MDDFVSWPQPFSATAVKDAYGKPLCGYCISLEAWRRGLAVKVKHADYNKYTISSKEKTLTFNKSLLVKDRNRIRKLSKDKHRVKELLSQYGVNVPKGEVFGPDAILDDALSYAKSIGYPVVVKPLVGSLGDGVFTNIATDEELVTYYKYLKEEANESSVIVEKHFSGNDYRAFVIGDEAVAIVKRIPANVKGDGKSTIDQLISKKNAFKKLNPFLSKGLIKKDREVHDYINKSGYSLDSVLPEGEVLFLRGKANASAGGDTVDFTDLIPQRVKDAAVLAVKAIDGLEHCGVDVLFDEETEEYCILELNTRAQIGVNMYPVEGEGRNVPALLVDHYFPESKGKTAKFSTRIAFNNQKVRNALRGSVIDEVSISPFPRLSSILRRRFVFSCSRVSPATASDRVARLAKRYGILGFVRSPSEGKIEVVAVGARQKVIEFKNKAVSRMALSIEEEVKWRRTVKNCFERL
ncbi:hypothetical protein [Halomonas maura]|uniref:ATP-binding protein n=1 Tax=Halomonas maura TaxID=117606 RepID=UPI0025B5B8E0|nr:hypothetical protein [Halomonas maura]MDN3557463.1 hypothetical protein [Halomonas maura]